MIRLADDFQNNPRLSDFVLQPNNPDRHSGEPEASGKRFFVRVCAHARRCLSMCVFVSVLSHRGDGLHMQNVFTGLKKS